MNDTWTGRWNDRYSSEAFAYGEAPNNYVAERLKDLPAGAILFAAEGEGRNAVYAAKLGWQAAAFDISIEGKNKAALLAEANNVTIDYRVGELADLGFDAESFDAVALIYAHFPAGVKSFYHKALNNYLHSGGYVIFEAFSKEHLNYLTEGGTMGGPKDVDALFSVDEIKADFANYEIIELSQKEIVLNEGLFHNGKASVIRFFGRKK